MFKRLIVFLSAVPLLAAATVEESQQPPQSLQPYFQGAETIMAATVTLETGKKETTWLVPQRKIPVIFSKLRYAPAGPHKYDEFFNTLPSPKGYKGVVVKFANTTGGTTPPFRVFGGAIYSEDGTLLYNDSGRQLEYWLAGTAQTYAHQKDVLEVLPVFDFEQCINLGHVVVDTTPRQCLMPNEKVMLDMPESLTSYDFSVQNFDECLQKGIAIIQSFPRRCIGPTGLLFAEPPRRPDGSIILPEEQK